jgi:hypothetical protein
MIPNILSKDLSYSSTFERILKASVASFLLNVDVGGCDLCRECITCDEILYFSGIWGVGVEFIS